MTTAVAAAGLSTAACGVAGAYRNHLIREHLMAKAWTSLIVGVLLALSGAVWTLQGVGVVGGSVMSGVTLWAIIGPVVLAVGLVLAFVGLRRLRGRSKGHL